MSRPIITYKKKTAAHNSWQQAKDFFSKHSTALFTSAAVGAAIFVPVGIALAEITHPQNTADKNKNFFDSEKTSFADQYAFSFGNNDNGIVVLKDAQTGSELYYWPEAAKSPTVENVATTVIKKLKSIATTYSLVSSASAAEQEDGGINWMPHGDLSMYDNNILFPTTHADLSSFDVYKDGNWIHSPTDWVKPLSPDTAAAWSMTEDDYKKVGHGKYFYYGPDGTFSIIGKGLYGFYSYPDGIYPYTSDDSFYRPNVDGYMDWLDSFAPLPKNAAQAHMPDIGTIQNRMKILLGEPSICAAYNEALCELKQIAPDRPVSLIGMANILVAVCERDPDANRAVLRNGIYERTFYNLQREIAEINKAPSPSAYVQPTAPSTWTKSSDQNRQISAYVPPTYTFS